MSFTKTNIQKYLQKKDTSYKIFDIKYTQKEKQTIDSFKIDNEIAFSYYGKFDKNTELNGDCEKTIINELKGEYIKTKMNILDFITNIGNNTVKDILVIKNIIYKLLDKVLNSYNKKYILLVIRIFLPNKKSNIIRWHTDNFENQSKFVTVLKGPSTLFIDDKDIKSKKIFFENRNLLQNELDKIKNKEPYEFISTYQKYDKILRKKMKDCKVVHPTNNQGVIFLTDNKIDNKTCAIHSMPNVNDKRLFISIMCGTKEEIVKI